MYGSKKSEKTSNENIVSFCHSGSTLLYKAKHMPTQLPSVEMDNLAAFLNLVDHFMSTDKFEIPVFYCEKRFTRSDVEQMYEAYPSLSEKEVKKLMDTIDFSVPTEMRVYAIVDGIVYFYHEMTNPNLGHLVYMLKL